ncbi:cell cycle checkpoint Rad17 [Ceratobasidium sp. AG-Ba]|nr:cell cycle checkpoint Rad17 [Ceratobasidium sp. AG-Ba]
MARKSPTKPQIRKNTLKRSTLSSDSLFGFGTQSSSGSQSSARHGSQPGRQLSVPKFTLSQKTTSPSQQVIDLTGDDDDDVRGRTPIPVPAIKKVRRTSPTPVPKPTPPLKSSGSKTIRDQGDGESGGRTEGEESLWVDLHAPTSPETLAVHPRKVEDVRKWLNDAVTGGPTGKLKRYRRILVLTGPSGCGKTATLRVLAQELDAEIVEWFASSDEFISGGGDYDYESAVTKLVAFLDRASSYTSLSLASSTSAQPPPSDKQKILLLEDLPPLSHYRTRSTFHAALVRFAESFPGPPLVIIISDAGLRADDTYTGGGQDALDIRNVLPPALLSSHYVMQIKFNPIAATIMRKALSSIIATRLSLPVTSKTGPIPRETLDLLVEASSGDIRSAIMAVQFACSAGGGFNSRSSSGKGKKGKRYGDPDEPGEAPVQVSKPLPNHLKEFERRASKVDVAAMHADSPVDASLFTLYVQHNYTQYCNEMDECWNIADALSLADGGMGILDDGPTMSSALAHHAFEHVARSALLALPSPVPRRSQVLRKPGWFAARTKEREAESAVEDAKTWLNEHGGWDRRGVILDAGVVLNRLGSKAPPSVKLFTSFRWDAATGMGDALGEEEAVETDKPVEEADLEELEKRAARVGKVEKKPVEEKGWLSDDDIDDF